MDNFCNMQNLRILDRARMVRRDDSPDDVTRRADTFALRGGIWMAALAIAATLASHDCQPVAAFTIPNPARTHRAALPMAPSFDRYSLLSLSSTSTSSTIVFQEERSTLGLWGHDRNRNQQQQSSSSMIMSSNHPSQMFLKAGQASLQNVMSSLSSDFYDASTSASSTTRPRFPCDNEASCDVSIPQRTRGVLGFTLQDHGDHLISSSRSPPPMEESTTSLHSSTADQSQQEQQQYQYHQEKEENSQLSEVIFRSWNLAKSLDDEWAAFESDDRNPILNRSPTSNSAERLSSSVAWFPWMPTITQIEALTVRELKQICGQRGLKQAGNKAELQQRVWDWTRQQQHRQRRLMIGSSDSFIQKRSGKRLRLKKTQNDSNNLRSAEPATPSVDGSSTANSLGEWARTYNITPLQERREKIIKEKREGKAVEKPVWSRTNARPGAPETPTKEYLSKLFEAPSSQYSNFEVKQMYLAAKAADQSGDRILGKQILHKLKEATPHDARIYRRLARMDSEEGNTNKARQVLQEGIRLHPNNAYLWHGLGQLELKAGNSYRGRMHFVKALELDPAFPNPYHALGTFEHSHGNIARAMKILKKGLQYCPKNHRLHHALGDLYREAKMLDMAERSFRLALEHGPEVSRGFAYTSLAHVSYELGDIDQCRSWLRKSIALNDGRQAKAWLALARLEESEGNIEAARSVCITALNQYEKGLLKNRKRILGSKQFDEQVKDLTSSLKEDPDKLRNQMLLLAPKYRAGDHFLKVYTNWARLEGKNGATTDTVDYVYNRAATAFPLEWKIDLDWARYHVHKGHDDRARLLFGHACMKVGSRNAEPFRVFAGFEMDAGNYKAARNILYRGAVAMSDSSDRGIGNDGLVELYYTWAVCEWHLGDMERAEVLFDQAMRLTKSEQGESPLRSTILYAIARLEFARGEYHLAQHCICLCLKENSMPDGMAMVWDLWTEVASAMGDYDLADQVEEQSDIERNREEDSGATSLAMKAGDLLHLMRKDPWHYKIFEQPSSIMSNVCLPEFE